MHSGSEFGKTFQATQSLSQLLASAILSKKAGKEWVWLCPWDQFADY